MNRNDKITDRQGNQYEQNSNLKVAQGYNFVKYLDNMTEVEVPLLSAGKKWLKKPITVILTMEPGKKFRARNNELEISLIADTPSDAMKKFMNDVEKNLDKYNRKIDIIIDKNIRERYKEAWLKLAEK